MLATELRATEKRRIWRLIKTHQPDAAEFLTAWQEAAKSAGEKGVEAVAFQGEWSDGHDETAEDERRRKHMDKYLKARRLDYDSTEYAMDVRRMRK